MEIIIIAVVAVVLGGLIYINRNKKKLDKNNDGKVDVQEVKAAVKEEVKEVAKKTATKVKATVSKKPKK